MHAICQSWRASLVLQCRSERAITHQHVMHPRTTLYGLKRISDSLLPYQSAHRSSDGCILAHAKLLAERSTDIVAIYRIEFHRSRLNGGWVKPVMNGTYLSWWGKLDLDQEAAQRVTDRNPAC